MVLLKAHQRALWPGIFCTSIYQHNQPGNNPTTNRTRTTTLCGLLLAFPYPIYTPQESL